MITPDMGWAEGTDMLINVGPLDDMRALRECPKGLHECEQCQQRWNRIWAALATEGDG